jgi:hypothetical protein
MGQRMPAPAPAGGGQPQGGGGGDINELIKGVMGGLDILVKVVGQASPEAGKMIEQGASMVQQGIASAAGGGQGGPPPGQPSAGGPNSQPAM